MGKILGQHLVKSEAAVIRCAQHAVLIEDYRTANIDKDPVGRAVDITEVDSDESQPGRHVQIDHLKHHRRGELEILHSHDQLTLGRLTSHAVDVDEHHEGSAHDELELGRFEFGGLKLGRLHHQAQAIIAVQRQGVLA